jgi:tRNA wybutosine-synthesizing protein 2
MSFKEQLREKLLNIIPEEKLGKLPSGFQRIGDVIILNLSDDLKPYTQEIGKQVLELFPTVQTICNKEGGITGEFREPQIEVIAGDTNTITTHIESGCMYRFDVQKIMFAKGNVTERTRIPKQVKKNEIIVDMFAGIGYFTIPLAKLPQNKPKKIYAIELNPLSFKFLQENITLNKLKNVEAINGDNRTIIAALVKQGIKADRIIMGYLPPPKAFLPAAFSIAKKHTMIHYEDIIAVDKKEEEIQKIMNEIQAVAEEYNFKIKLILAKPIKSYRPRVDHYVFDVEVE